MKMRKLGSPVGILVAMAVLASGAAAVYVATSTRSAAMTPVTPVDLRDARAAGEALAFDPFEVEDAASATDPAEADEAALAGSSPDGGPGEAPPDTADAPSVAADPDVPEAAEAPPEEPAPAAEVDEPELAAEIDENQPLGEADDVELAAADDAPAVAEGGEPDVQTGVAEAGEAAGKMKFGITPTLAGAALAAGAGGAAAGVTLGGGSDTTTVRTVSVP